MNTDLALSQSTVDSQQAEHTNGYYFCSLGTQNLAEILEIEQAVYTHPWSLGNFTDSISSGYILQGLRNSEHTLCGYFVLMPVYEEMHLLNIAVAADQQNQGLGRCMLDQISRIVPEHKLTSVLLEVRVSAQKAIHLYQAAGFCEIGRRKSYYPVTTNSREDAIVMRLEF